MIKLFNIPDWRIDTDDCEITHWLHGSQVKDFEEKFASYVGAEYAVSFNSASSALFLIAKYYDNLIFNIPSIIPPVVPNAIINAGRTFQFVDNTGWVGHSYILANETHFRVIDSAQQVNPDQFKKEACNNDLMIFSFFPTKPIASVDGGMVVSNDREKIEYLRTHSMNGMTNDTNSWDKIILWPGWKMYMNTVQAWLARNNFLSLDIKKEKLSYVRNRYNEAFSLDNKSDHLYRIMTQNNDRGMRFLKSNDIESGIHYRALHTHPVYSKYASKMNLAWSEQVSKMTLSIPFHEKLTDEEIDKVIKYVKQIIRT